MKQSQNLVIYESPNQEVQLRVALSDDSVWLSQKQMSDLFDKNVRTINEHIQNVFSEGELSRSDSVIRKFRITAKDGKTYNVEHYNLDVIISVGYRVKSLQGTQFRIWASKVLKDHIIKGYSINRHRLPEISWDEFDQMVAMIKSTSKKKLLPTAESMALLDIIARYTKSFVLLQQVDTDSLPDISSPAKSLVELEQKSFEEAIFQLKSALLSNGQASDIFGTARADGLSQVLGSIYQTFDGQDLYPSIEEKASHLLYFVIKDHPFIDGNKRIGSLVFVWFLEKNNYLRKKSGETKINDNALVTLALLIAESRPKDKELMIKLVKHLICEE